MQTFNIFIDGGAEEKTKHPLFTQQEETSIFFMDSRDVSQSLQDQH
jgi:hypothetical protein